MSKRRGLRTVRLNAEKVLSWRLKQQLSQRAAAEMCGIGQVTYRRIEHGKEILTLCAHRVSERLEIPLSKLIIN